MQPPEECSLIRTGSGTATSTALMAAGALALSACGGGGGGDAAAFCEQSDALEASAGGSGESGMPSSEQLQRVIDVAPDEIRDELQTLVSALEDMRQGDTSGLQDPEVQEAAQAVQSFSAENCGDGGS